MSTICTDGALRVVDKADNCLYISPSVGQLYREMRSGADGPRQMVWVLLCNTWAGLSQVLTAPLGGARPTISYTVNTETLCNIKQKPF